MTKQKVEQWFIEATELLEIDIQEVSNLKLLDGLALNMLKKEDWIRRSPEYGDILFNMWRKDQLLLLRTGRIKEYDESESINVLPTASSWRSSKSLASSQKGVPELGAKMKRCFH